MDTNYLGVEKVLMALSLVSIYMFLAFLVMHSVAVTSSVTYFIVLFSIFTEKGRGYGNKES